MELSDKSEDFLEQIWVEINERKSIPDLRILKDNEDYNKLLSLGYISKDPKNPLTVKGMEMGRLCVRRHRLAERLFTDVFRVKSHLVHKASCIFEHALHKGIEDNICILLGHPKTCPHGQKIPPGKCCEKQKTDLRSFVLPVSKMKKNESGKIVYVHTQDKNLLHKIIAMHALPGSHLKLLHRFPSFVFEIGHSQFAVDKKIAEQIHVWIDKS